MLQLCNIVKNYPTATTTVQALRGISVAFRESEFVAILGPSGCGKTTMLNIIGGLDRYTSGDLIIGGVSTVDFDDEHWDAYRNATIGFVFQSYNLIPHLTVLENVELALSLSGEKKRIRKSKAVAALKRVGMEEEINKRPNQLSGGQMQRVAIARAIVNDPKIILADEPTGALDSGLSVQVMNILQEISKDRLVIMVTHNNELAREYCNRTVRFKDGQIVEDTNPFDPSEIIEQITIDEIDENSDVQADAEAFAPIAPADAQAEDAAQELTTDIAESEEDEQINAAVEKADEVDYSRLFKDAENQNVRQKKVSNHKRKNAMKNITGSSKATFDKLGLNRTKKKRKDADFKPTSMSLGTAFGLSLRNLISKRRRTFFTAFAGSIGIIGLGLVLAISNGFDVFVQKMQTEMLSGIPIGIYEYNIEVSAIMDIMSDFTAPDMSASYPEGTGLGVQDNITGGNDIVSQVLGSFFKSVSRNNLTKDFETYMRNMPEENCAAMQIYYGTRFNLVNKTKDNDGNEIYVDASQTPEVTSAISIATTVLGENGQQPKFWHQLVGDKDFMLNSYDLLDGEYPQNENELLLCVTENSKINKGILESFGIDMYERDEDGKVVMQNGAPKFRENLDTDDFIGAEIKLLFNNDYYQRDGDGIVAPDDVKDGTWKYTDQQKLEALYNNGNARTLKISGVIRPKKGVSAGYVGNALCYTPELGETVMKNASQSFIVELQNQMIEEELGPLSVFGTYIGEDEELDSDLSIFSFLGSKLSWTSYLKAIGANTAPTFVKVYPVTYAQKIAAGEYISQWNSKHGGEVGYFDVSEMFIYNLNMMIDLVSILLIAVASISLVVSTAMIGVITSNSVIERIREIGILRSLGARKRDIRNVFIAETSMIGLSSGIMGIVITYVLSPLISLIIEAVAGVGDLLHFHPLHALLLVVLSFALTIISGIIPAISASRKNVVDALRVE